MKDVSRTIVLGSIREVYEKRVKKFETPDHRRFLIFRDAVEHRTKVCVDHYFRTHVNKIAGQGAMKYFTKHRAEAIELGVILLDQFKPTASERRSAYELELEQLNVELRQKNQELIAMCEQLKHENTEVHSS